jgi:hypothetical protein
MEMAQLMGHAREGVPHGVSDGGLAITDGADHGDPQRLLDLRDEDCEIVASGRQEAFGQEHCARETIAQDPQDCMADIRLEAIESQDDSPVELSKTREALAVLERQGEECVVAI